MLEKGKTYRVLKPEMVVVVVKDWGEGGVVWVQFLCLFINSMEKCLCKIPNPEWIQSTARKVFSKVKDLERKS